MLNISRFLEYYVPLGCIEKNRRVVFLRDLLNTFMIFLKRISQGYYVLNGNKYDFFIIVSVNQCFIRTSLNFNLIIAVSSASVLLYQTVPTITIKDS